VRLFDRGDVNTYKDELTLLLTLARTCYDHSATDSLQSDIQSLLTSVTSPSADQSQSTDFDLIALIRRYIAERWLTRLLIGNSVT